VHVDVWVCVRIVVDLCGVLCAWQPLFYCPKPPNRLRRPPPRALDRSMAENQWVVTFEDVQNPAQMQSRLDDSQFAKRCDSFLSRIVGRNIICSFCSIIGKQALQKKCVQTFKDYGTFKRYNIIQTPGRLNRNPESRKTGKMEHLCVGP
jgi:hypothetical protein